jgi:hypothetical protein
VTPSYAIKRAAALGDEKPLITREALKAGTVELSLNPKKHVLLKAV